MKSTNLQSTQNTLAAPSLTRASNYALTDNSPCDLTMAQVADISGIKLGMTPEEVLALFPGSKEDAEVISSLSRPPSKFGISGFVIRPAKYLSKGKFAGITQMTFTLLDGRVSTFSVAHNGPEWPHVDNFVANFTSGTNLPAADAWKAYVGMDNNLKVLTCADFDIQIYAGGVGGNNNYVLMRDLTADKKLNDRREKAREKARPEASTTDR